MRINSSRKRFRILSRVISLMLIISMLLPQTLVLASTQEAKMLNQLDIPDEILKNDLFYLSTTSQVLYERDSGKYLLKIGRGGGLLRQMQGYS